MKIALELIKPSPNPVRTQWDEDKMEELAQSIKEQGLIVPIKVRPVMNRTWLEPYSEAKGEMNKLMEDEFLGDTFEIVYGHRRVEACKRIGLGEIEAIVEGVDDEKQLIQALIENLVREDMNPIDKGNALEKLKEMSGISYAEMGRRGIINRAYSKDLRALREEPEEIQLMVKGDGCDAAPLGEFIVRTVRKSGLGESDRIKVLEKVQKEDLSGSQARRIAEAIKEAPTEQAKKRLLEIEYSPFIHDHKVVEKSSPHDDLYHDDKPSLQDQWERVPAVKAIVSDCLEAIKAFASLLRRINQTIKVEGKFAPEAKQYIATKLRSLKDQIDQLLIELER